MADGRREEVNGAKVDMIKTLDTWVNFLQLEGFIQVSELSLQFAYSVGYG